MERNDVKEEFKKILLSHEGKKKKQDSGIPETSRKGSRLVQKTQRGQIDTDGDVRLWNQKAIGDLGTAIVKKWMNGKNRFSKKSHYEGKEKERGVWAEGKQGWRGREREGGKHARE